METLKKSIVCGFDHLAGTVTRWTGSAIAFGTAVGIIIVWIICGPLYGYSETWQLVVNTGTTIVTFLMVFLIQQSQNKDSHALHLKLDELLLAIEGASNRLVAIEDLDDEQLRRLIDTAHLRASETTPEKRPGEAEASPGA